MKYVRFFLFLITISSCYQAKSMYYYTYPTYAPPVYSTFPVYPSYVPVTYSYYPSQVNYPYYSPYYYDDIIIDFDYSISPPSVTKSLLIMGILALSIAALNSLY